MPSVLRSSLARRVGPGRSVAFASVPLAQLAALRSTPGSMRPSTTSSSRPSRAACGVGSLERGAPLHRMRVKVPVSLHRADEPADALGNDDSFFFVDLPLGEPDATMRLRAISGACTRRKRHGDAVELGTLLHCASALAPAVGGTVITPGR